MLRNGVIPAEPERSHASEIRKCLQKVGFECSRRFRLAKRVQGLPLSDSREYLPNVKWAPSSAYLGYRGGKNCLRIIKPFRLTCT